MALDLSGQVVAVYAPNDAPNDAPNALVRAWLGVSLLTRSSGSGVPDEIASAARRLVDAAKHGEGVARERVEVDAVGAVELVAMAVMGVRRAHAEVREVLANALAPMERQARARDVELVLRVDPEVPDRVPMDAEKVAWAVATLVGNALRYVRAGSRSLPGGCVQVTARRDEATDELLIEVEDDGVGIAPEVLARLVAAEADTRGALALRVARDVVRAQGGSLTIESSTEGDPGTRVTLRLPLGSGSAPRST